MKSETIKKILQGFGFVAVILTLMPFVALDYWWIRAFDFPHLQLTFLTVAAIILFLIKFDLRDYRDYIFIIVLCSCALFQFTKIYPYTALADFEVLDADPAKKGVSLYTANVLQKNKKHNLLTQQFNTFNADILLFTETHRGWQKSIRADLPKSYKNKVEAPLPNAYGMLLYSKLELIDPQVKYLVSDSIPSIHAKVKLTSNDTIQLYAIHPTPPMPQENPSSSDRDTEMMFIAKMALESKYPVVVIGDFNDVAWSQTSILFQKVSRLLDVRKGRGLYNTYNAESKLMRWPLDHIFIGSEFRLKKVEKCEDIGSDHFPLYTELTYEPRGKHLQLKPYPTKGHLQRAQDQIDAFEKKRKKKLEEKSEQ